MKYVPATANLDKRLFQVLLTPSWLSGTACVLVGVGLTIGTIILTRYQSSALKLELANSDLSFGSRYQLLTGQYASNQFISNLPLLLFWAFVGVIVYLFVVRIFAAIKSTAALHTELEYMHVDRQGLLRVALRQLLIRIAVFTVWVFYALAFLHHIVRYVVATAAAVLGQANLGHAVVNVVLAAAVMIVALHIHIVLLRLFFLRPRLFSSALYVD